MTHLKRKRTEPDTSASLKRLRCNSLEQGFAHLNLTSPIQHVAQATPIPMDDIILQTDPELSAKPPSGWYEPEKDRIVITNLDALSDSDSEEKGETSNDTFEISPAVIKHIEQQRERSLKASAVTEPSTSQALILFKPPPPLPELSRPPSPPPPKQSSLDSINLSSVDSPSSSPPLMEDEDVMMMDVEP